MNDVNTIKTNIVIEMNLI